MKKITLMLILLMLFTVITSSEVVNKIVARVDDEIITQYELDENVSFYLTQVSPQGLNIDEIKKEILDSMIEDILIMKEAEALELTDNIDESLLGMNVDMAIDNIRAQYNSEEEFLRALKMAGLTLGKLRENYSKKIKESELSKIIIEKQVKSKVNIEKDEMEKYYEENKERYQKAKGKVKLSQIMITGSKTGAFGIAESIRKRIEGGADFHEIAKSESDDSFTKQDGGKLGILNTDDLNKKITSEIVKLNPGQITSVIDIGGNYYIFLLEKKDKPEEMSFEEAFDYVKADLYRIKIQEAYKEYIDELKKKSYIKITL
ncbi:peptidyl-prolyl cis-trans isomerase [Candidatus Dependentiae bacterium]|nr:peptidyl-prolyl cis-trans isomerase [Candidatus Dependentiae bacterium]